MLMTLESAAFVIPIHSFRSTRLRARLACTSSNQQEEEVERYRNRAALTESVLKEKMQEMKLLKGKVNILQDVVKKLKTSQSSPTNIIHQQEELTAKWREEETKRIQANEEIKYLQRQLNQTKAELAMQATQHEKSIQELHDKHQGDRRAWKQQQMQHQKEEKEMKSKLHALQKEVLDIDQSLETTQGELQTVQKRLAAREDELRSLVSKQDKKQQALEQKLQTILEEKDDVQKRLDEQLQGEQERRESIQIASAAVKAAEAREANLRDELEVLQQKFEQLKSMQSNREEERIKNLMHELELERITSEKNLKRCKQEYVQKLEAQREIYEAELRLFRANIATQVNQNATVSTNGHVSDHTKRKRKGVWNRVRSLLRRRNSKPTD